MDRWWSLRVHPLQLPTYAPGEYEGDAKIVYDRLEQLKKKGLVAILGKWNEETVVKCKGSDTDQAFTPLELW